MTILIERIGRVVIAKINRPEKLNALNSQVMNDLITQLKPLDDAPEVGCFIITGSEKAFAAGADISEMAEQTYSDMYKNDFLAGWEEFARLRTPKIAAVSGYALG